jgi:hypothetical protein
VRDPSALDIFNDEIRNAVIGGSSVDQLRDVGVLKPHENLPFAAKTAQCEVCIEPAAYELDRRPRFVLLVRALGNVDDAHTSATEFTGQPPGPDQPAFHGWFRNFVTRIEYGEIKYGLPHMGADQAAALSLSSKDATSARCQASAAHTTLSHSSRVSGGCSSA